MKTIVLLATFLWAALAGKTFYFRSDEPSAAVKEALPKEEEADFSLADWRYPGAEALKLSGDSLTLKSSDSAKEIADWYKKKIADLNLSINNFIQTDTNGEIESQLTGSGRRKKVKVEISRTAADPRTMITISISGLGK